MTCAGAGAGAQVVEGDREGSMPDVAERSPAQMINMNTLPRKRSDSFPDEQVLQLNKKLLDVRGPAYHLYCALEVMSCNHMC